MTRNRTHRTWWRTCEVCGLSETGSGYSIHNRFKEMCCDEPFFKSQSPTRFLVSSNVFNNELFRHITQDQIEFGIAWALEGF